ncbi:Asp-tRNA(Asn)/Glu-tRNA(Gln) amidotransferase subunit GatB [bacterium]|nr:Asp-tRNA(Asn)/Glu-tRNA(Gln) amidotransferase subunit GatB [bacterium]
MENYDVVIGLEVHVELSTNSKLFCGCSTKFGSEPNTQACPVCAGMPGALPVLNGKVVELAIKTGVALACEIAEVSKFARKHYFYPDLSKNYQISQHEPPIAYNGHLLLDGKKIKIKRIHIEEDAGKLIHSDDEFGNSFVDLNRSGMSLLEIVTEPDIKSSLEAEKFLNNLKHILEYLEISDCNMEEGSLRCDANVSVKLKGDNVLGVKTEIKNLNSFKAVRKAIDYEFFRQVSILKQKMDVMQESRLWNEELQITEGMRSKEEAHDYRYFSDPDLPSIYVNKDMLDKAISEIEELPSQRKERLIEEYNLTEYDAEVLTSKKELSDYFEKTASKIRNPKVAVNWIMGDLMAILKEDKIEISNSPVTSEFMVQILTLIEENKITGTSAKEVLYECFKSGKPPEAIVKEKDLIQINDDNLVKDFIKEVLDDNPKAIQDYKAGRKQALGYLVGQIVKKTEGKIDPKIITDSIKKALEEL